MPIYSFNGIMPKIHPSAFVAPSADIIGDVEIGPEANIWYGCVLRGDVEKIRIGARTNIQDGTVIHVASGNVGTGVSYPTLIGSDVTVGHQALIHACSVGNGGFVGMGAVLMDGVVVEDGGMVGAGALVTPGKRVKSGELWLGSPAKCARMLKDEEKKMMVESAAHYVSLATKYR